MNQLLNKWRNVVLGLSFVTAAAGSALAAEPLVDAVWAKANAGKQGVVFIDFQPATDFMRGHIPGAVNTNFAKDGWREERASDKVPDMLGEPAKLAELIGKLGIDNDTHVVMVPPGANSTDMGMGTRIYWTFKVNFRKDMIATADDVKKAKAAGIPLVDNRPEDQFVGINRHPKSTASGTLEGAKNFPNAWMTVNGQGEFRKKPELEKLYKVAGVPTSGEQINFCNTGHWASVGWFVSSELMGNKNARMYDGSMTEWTITKAGPVDQKIKLD